MGLSNYLPSSRISQSGVCTSTTRPASPYEGQIIYETDTNRVLVWDNSAWVMIADTDQPPGLQLIQKKSFTNSTTVEFDDCFSAEYTNYRLLVNITASTNVNTQLQMRYGNGSTFSDTGIYSIAVSYLTTAGASGAFSTTNTSSSHLLNQIGGNRMPAVVNAEIYQPFLAQRTAYTMQSYGSYDSSGLQTRVHLIGSGSHDSATSYASLRILNGAAQNMSGEASVYGYRI